MVEHLALNHEIWVRFLVDPHKCEEDVIGHGVVVGLVRLDTGRMA